MRAERFTKRRGFSLIEVLITCGVVAVLATLLVPSLAGTLAGAKRATCAGNLRSIGGAFLTYAGESNGALPPGLYWDVQIAPYLGISDMTVGAKVLLCPEDKRALSTKPRSYAVNAQNTASPGRGVFSRNATDLSMKLASIPTPSWTILAVELFTGNNESSRQFSGAYGIIDGWVVAGSGSAARRLADGSYYHRTGQNYLFADGHVECLKDEAVVAAQAEGWRDGRWRAYMP